MLPLSRAKPRPSKKARQENTAEENAPSEPDAALNVDATILEDLVDDPPIRDEVVAPEEDFVNPSGPTDQFVVTTHTKDDENNPSGSAQANDPKDDEVVITGEGRTEPGNPVALAKHTAKEEMSALNKGKWDVDLAAYSALGAQDIHSGYLNRLYTSRDYEANLVKMMKDKFEVTSLSPYLSLYHCSPQGS